MPNNLGERKAVAADCAYRFEDPRRRRAYCCGFGAHADVSCSDGNYCIFHAPESVKRNWSSAQVDEFNHLVFDLIIKSADAGEDVDLTGIVFPGDVDFQSLHGHQLPRLTFRGATFLGAVSFEGLEFPNRVVFEWAKFFDTTNFKKTVFGTWGDFRRTSFYRFTDFTSAIFKGWGHFTEAEFHYEVRFTHVRFSSDANFESAEFDRGAFAGWANLTDTGLSEKFDIEDERIFGLADFALAKFSRPYFNESVFQSRADFSKCRFNEAAYFSDVKFRKFVTFSGAEFNSITRFRNTDFGSPPRFHNARLHQDTDFRGANFPTPPTEDAARAYRVLKLAMEETRARDDEANFHAHELDIRRKLETTPHFVKFASLLYRFGSDYGRRIDRPLIVLLGTVMFFAFVYWSMAIPMGNLDALSAVYFSLHHVVRPFLVAVPGYEKDLSEWSKLLVDYYPNAVVIIAMIQSVISVGLLGLFILSLRRKFRM